MDSKATFEQALLDPSATYGMPQAVVDAADLTQAQKIELLRRWNYDAAELSVAEEEGMGGGEASQQRQVLLALEALGAELDLDHPSPNKQHGL